MDPLSTAIEGLYQAFADVPTPRHIDGCPCCIGEKRIPSLLATPLRELTSQELSRYAASALFTVGDVSDYLYFLPRILELSILESPWWPDIEVTAHAIASTDFPAWPAARRTALIQLLHAVFDELVRSGPYFEIDRWLCAVAIVGLDVRPYLAKIETNRDAVLSYFEDNIRCFKDGKLSNGFWQLLPNEGHDVIVRWLRSESVRKISFDAYGCVMPTTDE